MSASLSIVLPLGPSYARSAARLMGVVCHHRLEKGASRTERRGLCDESHTSANTIVVLHGYHTRRLFRLAFVSTKRTRVNRTRRPSSSSLWLLFLAMYHTISSFGNMWQTVQICAIVKARAPCTLLLRLPGHQYRSKAPYSCVGPAAPLELARTSRRGCPRVPDGQGRSLPGICTSTCSCFSATARSQ